MMEFMKHVLPMLSRPAGGRANVSLALEFKLLKELVDSFRDWDELGSTLDSLLLFLPDGYFEIPLVIFMSLDELKY